ncbi:MAG: serine/threonine-protein kinase [Tepidisphaeraceae bacterium]
MAVTSGQRVGEYVLDQLIGKGGFGQVWRARHHVWVDKLVAVKIPTDPSYLRDLQREGAFAPELEHINIVKALGFDPYAQIPYLAMEYVPGTSLRPLIEQKKLNVDQSIAIMQQLLAALKHAHAAGFVHRDIKPENLLINERTAKEGYAVPGLVKLSDFGLGAQARKVSAESIAMSMEVNSSEAKGLVGTLEYMAPEQRAVGTTVDGRADLYAAGVILFEMLTGQKPAGTDVPTDLNPNLPKWLDDVFRKAYTRVEKRFANAEEFSNALKGAQFAPPPMPPELKSTIPPKRGIAPPPIPPSIATPPTRVKGRCPSCRGTIGDKDQFCIHCGTQLVTQVRRCPSCGGYPEPDDRFCVLCGSELNIPVRSA